jgi:hypothetical protein
MEYRIIFQSIKGNGELANQNGYRVDKAKYEKISIGDLITHRCKDENPE